MGTVGEGTSGSSKVLAVVTGGLQLERAQRSSESSKPIRPLYMYLRSVVVNRHPSSTVRLKCSVFLVVAIHRALPYTGCVPQNYGTPFPYFIGTNPTCHTQADIFKPTLNTTMSTSILHLKVLIIIGKNVHIYNH